MSLESADSHDSNVLREKIESWENSGTAHIFWYMVDEHMYFWCHPGIMCSHAYHERFLKCAYIIFGCWIYDLTETANHNTMKHFEPFNELRIR